MSKPEENTDPVSGRPALLIMDADEAARGRLKWAFRGEYEVIEAGSKAEALGHAVRHEIPVGIINLGDPPSPLDPSEGMAALRELIAMNPLFKAVVISRSDGRMNAVKALETGAFDYFYRQASMEDARLTVRRAFFAYGMHSEDLSGCQGLGWPCDIIGLTPRMQAVFGSLRKVADISIPTLISGEHGTGRETAARAVHRLGSRHAMPFISVHCAGAPEYILEDDLFGGNANGRPRKKGKIELSDGGILFLREISQIGKRTQERLLRFLQEQSLEAGDGKAAQDTKIISCSSGDMKELVKRGEFSEELYNRLCVITLQLPPLRERRDDIHMLALYFLKKYSREYNRPLVGFKRDAVEAMMSFPWPGNVKELESRVRRAAVICRENSISAEDLTISPAQMQADWPGPTDAGEAFKKKIIVETLAKNRWNISRAALELGVSRQYLSRLMDKYRLKR